MGEWEWYWVGSYFSFLGVGKIKIGQVTVKISQVRVADTTDITVKIGHAGPVTEMSTTVWRHARQSTPANQISQSRHVNANSFFSLVAGFVYFNASTVYHVVWRR